MPEQPFDEKDVLWRWKPTEEQKEACHYDLPDEFVLTAWDGGDCLVIKWWMESGEWRKQLAGGVLPELLRQLRESQEKEKKWQEIAKAAQGELP